MGVRTPLSIGDLAGIFECTTLVPTSDGIRDTVYLSGRGVLKLFEEADFETVRREKQLLDALRELPIPEVLQEPFLIRGKPCLLYQKMPGESLRCVQQNHICQIAQFMHDFHRLSAGMRSTNKRLFERDRLDGLIQQSADERLRQLFEATPLTLRNDGIIHGDLFLDNALFEEDRLSGVLDFSEACEGDFLFDLAVVAVSWCLNGNDPLSDIKLLLTHYDPSITPETFWPYMRYALMYYATTRYLAGRDYGELLERISLLERLKETQQSNIHFKRNTMSIKTITGKSDFAEHLRGKRGAFFLCLSNTETAEIPGITQAGIPGLIHLTPTLDAEFLCTGEVRSLGSIAETPKGVPTPGLITRAVHLLRPFGGLSLLDLGLKVKPQVEYFTLHGFALTPSASIATGALIDAETVFAKGVKFAQELQTSAEYLILGESVPSGTTTAMATALALGYDARDKFSSSFKNAPDDIRSATVTAALEGCKDLSDVFATLSHTADNMLIFNAGFILGLQNRDIPLVLAGGTQMAAVLLVVNSILRSMEASLDSSRLALCTTKWVYEDPKSDIKALLEMLDFPLNAYYADFDFSLTDHPALKLYDEGEAKEGVGAGGALMYGLLNGLSKEQITRTVESFLR